MARRRLLAVTAAQRVQFASSGTHTLRIQTREDGVQFDQVVLSPATYLIARPGQVTNDHDEHPEAARLPPGGSTPFAGTPLDFPGHHPGGGLRQRRRRRRLPRRDGRQCRRRVPADRRRPRTERDGGYDVGWISAGEWLNYTVNVAAAGVYTSTRASLAGSGRHVPPRVQRRERDRHDRRSPTPAAGRTGRTCRRRSRSPPGTQMRGSCRHRRPRRRRRQPQFDAFTPSIGAAPSPRRLSGRRRALPGTIAGGELRQRRRRRRVPRHDLAAIPAVRSASTDVDIEPASAGGYDVGWIAPASWLAYSVNVAAAGTYTRAIPRRRSRARADVSPRVQRRERHAAAPVPNTGGWQNWQTVSLTGRRGRRSQTRGWCSTRNGSGVVGNFDSVPVRERAAAATGGNTITVPPGGNLQAAIDAALPGDTILLAAGRDLSRQLHAAGQERQRATSRSDRRRPIPRCPATASAITPAYAAQLPKIRSAKPGMPAFTTDARRASLPAACSGVRRARTATATSSRSATARRHRTRSPWCRTTSSSTAATSTATRRRQKRGIGLNSGVDDHHQLVHLRHQVGGQDSQAIAAGTAPARTRSRTTTSKRPARTSCSAAPIRRSRTWFRPTSRSARTTSPSSWRGADSRGTSRT